MAFSIQVGVKRITFWLQSPWPFNQNWGKMIWTSPPPNPQIVIADTYIDRTYYALCNTYIDRTYYVLCTVPSILYISTYLHLIWQIRKLRHREMVTCRRSQKWCMVEPVFVPVGWLLSPCSELLYHPACFPQLYQHRVLPFSFIDQLDKHVLVPQSWFVCISLISD